ncbi:MAG: hypothetical protein COA71_14565 [SAR86 cluster bacterium]|uniref:Uncharacterized protein n=1 Tax=SAR86 cluster bacterium TaxID=2030880 RepID=A0A2A5C6X4_9GAMM|nr:MAG: hypothetical protein COA71_14565 [SAR86 cluster bacterium]
MEKLLVNFELEASGIVKILELLNERLEKHRASNDSIDASVLLRGQIAEIKYLKKRIWGF